MICIAVTRIKNEADIIEAFVRHHAKYFDAIIVSDDGSTDGSLNILEKLRCHGLPLRLLSEPCLGFEQSRFMTALMLRAFNEFDADWVAPIDADEFVELPPSTSLADVLPGQSEILLEMAWSNFAWSRNDDLSDELNPVLRLKWRMPSRFAMKKVLVPAAVGRNETAILWPGNHGLNLRDARIRAIQQHSIGLCHYPIRSVAQFTRKLIINYLQFAAYFGLKSGLGHQYDDPFNILKTGSDEEFRAAMEKLSRRYSPPLDTPQIEELPTLAPLRYMGGPLEFTIPDEGVLPHVLSYGEALAERIFALARAAPNADERETFAADLNNPS